MDNKHTSYHKKIKSINFVNSIKDHQKSSNKNNKYLKIIPDNYSYKHSNLHNKKSSKHIEHSHQTMMPKLAIYVHYSKNVENVISQAI